MARSPEDFQFGIIGDELSFLRMMINPGSSGEDLNIPVFPLGRMCSDHVVSPFGRAAEETPPPFDKKSKIAFREGVRTLEEILVVLDEKTRLDYMYLTSHYLKSRTVTATTYSDEPMASDQFFKLGLLVIDRVLKERKTFKEIAELDEGTRITFCPRGSFRLRNYIERTFYFWLNSFHYLMPEVPLRVPLGFQDSYIYKLGETRARNAFNRATAALSMADTFLTPDNYQLLIGSGLGSLRITTWISCLLAREEELFKKIGYSPALSDMREIQNFRRLITVLPRSALNTLTERIYLTKSRQRKANFFKCAFGSVDEALRFVDKKAGWIFLHQFIINAKEGIDNKFISVSDEATLGSIGAGPKSEESQLYPLDAIRLVWAKAASRKPFYAPDVRDALKFIDLKMKTFEDFIKSTHEERIQEEARRSYYEKEATPGGCKSLTPEQSSE